MTLTKTRKIGKLINANRKFLAFDSDQINLTYSKGSTGAGGSGTTLVVATIDDLPLVSTEGNKALVSSTNTLYLYNNGWYKIAIINNFNPQWITEPSGSYALNTNGTSTTITVLASDSDDVPITYTAVTNSGFDSIATITHDSDKHNVWTVTPIDSDNGTQSAGSGTVTFKASDGVNLVQAVSSFDITFVVSNSNYTTLLVYADSDSNNNQVDATSNHTITNYSGASTSTSSSFTPFHPGGYSVYFDGAGDYLSIPDSSDFDFGNGDFTIEFWAYQKGVNADGTGSVVGQWAASNRGWVVYLSSTFILFSFSTNGTNYYNVSDGSGISYNEWTHVAVVRDGNTMKIYKNGTETYNAVFNSTIYNSSRILEVGANSSGTYGDYLGYLKDVRIVKGSAVYTSAFTPPTKPLTAISNTSLLTCHLPYVADGSTNGHTITVNGNTEIARVGPYNYREYSKNTHSGSMVFDGVDDYLSVPDSTNLDFGAGDWTIEHWFYKTGALKNYDSLWGKFASNAGYWMHIGASGNILMGYDGNNYGTSTETIKLKRWYHIATVRHNGTLKVYLDGVPTSISYSYGGNNDNSTPFLIGALNGFSRPTEGLISDFRIVKGTAVYTSAFTPPSQPLTAISGTSLLTCTNKSDMWDQSGSYTIIDGGGSTEARGFAKFADDDSVQFIPITSWLRIGTSYEPLRWLNDDELRPGTFESWIYQTAQGNSGTGIYTMPSILGWGGTYLNFGVQGTQLRFYYWTGVQNYVDPSGATISLNTWHHVAFSNDSSNNLRIFLDGTLVHTISSFPGVAYASASNGDSVYLGTESQNTSSRFTGYLYNTRITEGLARYTANFTSPTSKLLG